MDEASLLTLIRHGQAQTGARDEASYDSLSPRGHQQARWLGAWLAASGAGPERLLAGSLRRQQETAAALGAALDLPVVTDARLNELDYYNLAADLQHRHDVPFPADREGFLAHLPQVMEAWSEGQIESRVESFANFEARIGAALQEAAERRQKVLMVSSGGAIAMALRLAMGLDVHGFARLALQIENTSLHRLTGRPGALRLDLFNAVPHLETSRRHTARSYL